MRVQNLRMPPSKPSPSSSRAPAVHVIAEKIALVRGSKVLLDRDLAALYEIETRVLLQAVKRNADRFPDDFMFQLTDQELANLRSQSVISSWGGRRYHPYAFTEQGVAMLSSVLSSPRAIAVNIEIVRTFVRLRQILTEHAGLARKLEALETKYDAQFKVVFDAIRELMAPKASKARRSRGPARSGGSPSVFNKEVRLERANEKRLEHRVLELPRDQPWQLGWNPRGVLRQEREAGQ